MENASKALIMAGSMLISIIVACLLMILIDSLTSYQQSENQNRREQQILSFNNSYEGYIRDDVRGNDVISLIGKVIDYNKRIDAGGEKITLKLEIPNPVAFSRNTEGNLLLRNSYVITNSCSFIDSINNGLQYELAEKTNPVFKTTKGCTYSLEALDELVNSYDEIFGLEKSIQDMLNRS